MHEEFKYRSCAFDRESELDLINADLRNLSDSTQMATIFFDRHLIIRSFTPAIAALYNLIPSDQGRPLTDIDDILRDWGLCADCRLRNRGIGVDRAVRGTIYVPADGNPISRI